jgi:hypothetical protein
MLFRSSDPDQAIQAGDGEQVALLTIMYSRRQYKAGYLMRWAGYLSRNGEKKSEPISADVMQRRVYILTDLYEPELRCALFVCVFLYMYAFVCMSKCLHICTCARLHGLTPAQAFTRACILSDCNFAHIAACACACDACMRACVSESERWHAHLHVWLDVHVHMHVLCCTHVLLHAFIRPHAHRSINVFKMNLCLRDSVTGGMRCQNNIP